MKTPLLATVVLSSLVLVSCGKKDDLNTKAEAKTTVKPLILGENDKGTCDKCDADIVLTKNNSGQVVVTDTTTNNGAIDVRPSYNTTTDTSSSTSNNVPMFDTGIRPSNSK